jgi:dihydroorotate dehydrogenase (NAD+) catalytic subunit
MNLSAKIGNLKIDPAIMNASGIFSYPHILKMISGYDFGALVTKSIGIEPREGFMEPILVQSSDETWLNAVGLPNPGHKLAKEELTEFYPLPKPLICSIFGGTEEELVDIAVSLKDCCDAYELNFSCPNIREGEKSGMVIGKDPELVGRYTKAVRKITRKPIIVKLTPNVDAEKLKAVAKAAEEAGADAISAINTVAPGMEIDIYAKKPVLTAKFGGVSGAGIMPIGIAAVYSIYETVKIPIIGIGGIRTAEDVIKYVEAGADAVGIGSAFIDKTTEEVGRYLTQLRTKLQTLLADERLGASSLKELKGVAHEL